MNIQCPNCQSLFILEDNLIPKDGRLLQCSKCNHKWFYKHIDNENKDTSIRNEVDEIEKKTEIQKEDIRITDDMALQHDSINDDKNIKKSKKNINYFNYFLVFIISIVAFIIIIDTFKEKLAFIFPNINFLLNNLYETLKDLILFFNNLIS